MTILSSVTEKDINHRVNIFLNEIKKAASIAFEDIKHEKGQDQHRKMGSVYAVTITTFLASVNHALFGTDTSFIDFVCNRAKEGVILLENKDEAMKSPIPWKNDRVCPDEM